ncbi:adenine phosphoribosyltransferase [Amycolatopsis sp. NBC_01480]|jgi:adenine phosphoribosyltransferase|uniref:adenine phosphoribosyltransferase n=1 Tax=Amycolatopsis sp. NBC_01480 TaxID=2903562 RepID=UPI002E29A567|nr:adenine phosphoribosyltransferase [Amycolatopsis sp. NBC_01480]
MSNQLRTRLRAATVWHGDRTDEHWYADVTGWWRAPGLLQDLGPALGALFEDERPTVVLGPESRGCLLGPLVALHFGVGFVEVRKNRAPSCDSDAWRHRTTPPDYRDRHLDLGFRKCLVHASDRVLMVDEWIETGGQALGVQGLVEDAEATWLGIATVVDGLRSNEFRRRLGLRSLINLRDL